MRTILPTIDVKICFCCYPLGPIISKSFPNGRSKVMIYYSYSSTIILLSVLSRQFVVLSFEFCITNVVWPSLWLITKYIPSPLLKIPACRTALFCGTASILKLFLLLFVDEFFIRRRRQAVLFYKISCT